MNSPYSNPSSTLYAKFQTLVGPLKRLGKPSQLDTSVQTAAMLLLLNGIQPDVDNVYLLLVHAELLYINSPPPPAFGYGYAWGESPTDRPHPLGNTSFRIGPAGSYHTIVEHLLTQFWAMYGPGLVRGEYRWFDGTSALVPTVEPVPERWGDLNRSVQGEDKTGVAAAALTSLQEHVQRLEKRLAELENTAIRTTDLLPADFSNAGGIAPAGSCVPRESVPDINLGENVHLLGGIPRDQMYVLSAGSGSHNFKADDTGVIPYIKHSGPGTIGN